MIAAGGSRRGRPAAGEREAFDAVGDDPAVDDAEPARPRGVAAVGHDRRHAQVGVAGDDRVLDVQDEGAGRVDELGQPPLRRPDSASSAAVTVEVVRGDVGVDRDRRPARQGRQLQLGQLDDDPVRGGQLGQPLDERDADVAAQDDRVGRVGRQDRGGERRRRRLALRAGHPDRRRRAEPQEEVRLRDDGRGVRVAGGARRRPAPASAPRRRGSVVG